MHPEAKDDTGFGIDFYGARRSACCAENLMQLGFHAEVWTDYHIQEGKESGTMICIKFREHRT
jgi:hypothetical protein